MNAIILTGSIATGKSTTANLLKLYGYSVISADEVAHDMLRKYSQEIEKMFGTSERGALRKIVFNDRKEREKLEKFLHPKIKEAILQKVNELEKYNVPYFLDIPLYFEKGNYDEFKKVVVVYAPYEIQLKRLMKRDKISKEEAEKLINLQIPIEKKKTMASYVIDNSQDLKHLQMEVEKFLDCLKKEQK